MTNNFSVLGKSGP